VNVTDRDPACLIVFIETERLRWNVAAIDQTGLAIPLLQSAPGDLKGYIGLEFDAQISFLRHRLASALQRGCDRMYVKQLKAVHFLLIADARFPNAADGITERLAEHFVQWMLNPPATFLIWNGGLNNKNQLGFERIDGDLPDPISAVVAAAMTCLTSQFDEPEKWELIVSSQKTEDKGDRR